MVVLRTSSRCFLIYLGSFLSALLSSLVFSAYTLQGVGGSINPAVKQLILCTLVGTLLPLEEVHKNRLICHLQHEGECRVEADPVLTPLVVLQQRLS